MSFVIYGCGTGRNFTVNPSTDLKIDLTKVLDVETLFGKSEEVKTIDENNLSSKIHVYFYVQKPGYYSYVSMKNLELEFINDILNGYVYQNSFEEPNTNFSDSLRNKIEIGVSNKVDVVKLFGEPSGKTNLPTNLINYSLGLNTVKINPEANESWIYSLKYFEDVYNTPKPYYKFLIFFFNSDQNVIDKYYVSNITREVIKPNISEH